MTPWLRALAELDQANEAAVLITLAAVRGSTPREAGAKMVVTASGQFDTIGGGTLEYTCIETARSLLRGSGGPVLRDFPLGPALGQCCGGHVSVLFEPLRPPPFQVAVFGAGHVGRALVTLLSPLPIRTTWADTRPEAIANPPDRIAAHVTRDPAGAARSLPAGTLVLVMTHDHQLDFDIVAAALPRTDLAGIGLIGSKTKRARFVRRLALGPEATGRLICPIGVAGVEGKRPEEIAIAVAAQILQIRDRAAQTPAEPATECTSCPNGCMEAPA